MSVCIYPPGGKFKEETHKKHANYSIKTSVQCIDVVLTGIMDKLNYSAGYI